MTSTEITPNGGASLATNDRETSSTAVAAQAKAEVEARFLVALNRPRDMEQVRVRLLKECARPRFAEGARYSKPVGGDRVEGPSVRFAEAALRHMGNLDVRTPTLYEDDEKRIVRVSVTDLETNATVSKDITVSKTVERRQPKAGDDVLGSRENNSGNMVYIIRATDDQLANKEAALVSKALRNAVLRLLPGDILEECMEQCMKTARDQDAQDPDAARKRIVDAFASLSIEPSDLRDYLGHELSKIGPAELDDLRKVYATVRDGETTWAAVLASKQNGEAEPEQPKGSRTDKLKDAVRQKAQGDDAPIDTTGEDANAPDAPKVQWGEGEGQPITDLSADQLARYIDAVEAEMVADPDLEPHLEQLQAEMERRRAAE